MSTHHLNPRFSKTPPVDLKKSFSDYACVAVILKPNDTSYDIAFIRRARNPKDPWSGQIAFPGGRRESHDPHDLATALRETKEEVGWALTENHFLGFLTDIQARNRSGLQNFFLRPVVFHSIENYVLNEIDRNEVDEVFWISLDHLKNEQNKTTISLPDRGVDFPGIKLPTGDTLWGLSYIITLELIKKLK